MNRLIAYSTYTCISDLKKNFCHFSSFLKSLVHHKKSTLMNFFFSALDFSIRKLQSQLVYADPTLEKKIVEVPLSKAEADKSQLHVSFYPDFMKLNR